MRARKCRHACARPRAPTAPRGPAELDISRLPPDHRPPASPTCTSRPPHKANSSRPPGDDPPRPPTAPLLPRPPLEAARSSDEGGQLCLSEPEQVRLARSLAPLVLLFAPRNPLRKELAAYPVPFTSAGPACASPARSTTVEVRRFARSRQLSGREAQAAGVCCARPRWRRAMGRQPQPAVLQRTSGLAAEVRRRLCVLLRLGEARRAGRLRGGSALEGQVARGVERHPADLKGGRCEAPPARLLARLAVPEQVQAVIRGGRSLALGRLAVALLEILWWRARPAGC